MTLDFESCTLHVLPLGPLETNCYIIADKSSNEAMVIDPAEEADYLLSFLEEQKLKCTFIVLTHGHYDHIGALSELAEQTAAQVAIHGADAIMLTQPSRNFSTMMGASYQFDGHVKALAQGDQLSVGGTSLMVIHTPGHTPGGICLHHSRFLLAGDTLFQMSIGRSDLPGGDGNTLIQSIKEKLMVLPDDLPVFPGHGPSTTIGKEKRGNPFLR